MNLMKTLVFVFSMSLILLIIPCLSIAQNVLVWDNDEDSEYIDPETGALVACEYGIIRALEANDVDYIIVSDLPNDISEFDITFVELGLYCVS
ncbi:MAG: hypothetical protein GY855_02165 [candidate division Zixibacteria bacterium]|nr:hypothetical protein [candidate division Zixibacteria bacterium]